MIILDHEAESFVFEEGFDTIIPIDYKIADGALVITAFPAVESVAKEFESRFSADPFCEEAFRWLHTALAPYMTQWGYEDDETERLLCCYALDKGAKVNHRIIRPETDFVDYDPDFRIFGAVDADEDGEEDDDIYYQENDRLYIGIIQDGELVSYAATSARYDSTLTGNVAIEVDTLPEYSAVDYGASSMAALALYISQKGQTVEFSCPIENTDAQKMAEKAGFEDVGKHYLYIGRKII